MPPAHKAQRIEKLFAGGVTGNDAAGITWLGADKSRQILCPGRGAEHQIKGIKVSLLETVQHTSGEDTALPTAFTDQGKFAWVEGF